MSDTAVKSKIGQEDINWWDGGSVTTFTRRTSTGGTVTLTKVGLDIDVAGVYGAVSYDSLNRAIAKAGSNQVTLTLRPGTWSLTDDLTIPANVSLKVSNGVTLSIATGKTLTVNGNIEAGPYQIFSGAGSTAFVAGSVVKTSWYADFATAITKLGSSKVRLEVTEAEAIDSTTVPINVELSWTGPGKALSVNGNNLLTVKGAISAGNYQILNGRLSYAGTVNVKWWGARGDGLGLTPADTGDDISTASWNSWDGRLFKTDLTYSPFCTTGSFVAPTTKPFKNTDTWDYIGCNQALWVESYVMLMVTGTGSTYNSWSRGVYFPAGVYKINVSDAERTTYNGLIIMRYQESNIFGDGKGKTTIMPNEAPTYFDANNKTTDDYYKLFTFYRGGPEPAIMQDLELGGPVNYSSDCTNLTLAYVINANAVRFNNLWLTSASTGINFYDSCSSILVKGVIAEYLYDQVIKLDAGSTGLNVLVDQCEFWDTAEITTQKGIVADGHVNVTNSRFSGFRAGAINADSAMLLGNYFRPLTQNGETGVSLTHDSVVTGNHFEGAYNVTALAVGHDSTVTGNRFKVTSEHPCIIIGGGAALGAVNLSITGNTFVKTNANAEAYNYAILATVDGVGFTGAEAPSTVISGNTFSGRAMQFPTLGGTWRGNTFDGVIGADSHETATTAQLEAVANAINTAGKYIGKRVYNSTVGRFVYSTGTAAADAWDDAQGSAAHNPV